MSALLRMGWGIPLPAPAKLNLFLHVVGRRPDGYHLLQTVFRLIDQSDRLTFTPRSDGELRLVRELPGVPAATDLTIRAAELLRQAAGITAGTTIDVDKRLPMGGGLGGGSSDAATTLVALNVLWGIRWPTARLAELGLTLGADVPVFVQGRNAFAEGVGERLTPVDLPARWYVVLVPQVSVPTGEIFADPALTRDTDQTTMAAFFAGQKVGVGRQGEADKMGLFGHNDLETVAVRRYPSVGLALDWLNRFAPARMTGTGACVFAEFAAERVARDVLEALPEGMTGFVARGLDVHPLADPLLWKI